MNANRNSHWKKVACTTGKLGICMHLLNIAPKERARAHLHENHETAIYVISGQAGMWHGQRLEEHVDINGGDFLHIPAGIPHLPYNPSQTETCAALIARDRFQRTEER